MLFDIDYTLFDTDLFKQSDLTTYKLFDEVTEVLENLSTKVVIGIFSQGEIVFQQTKLDKTGISNYFQQEVVHIVGDKDASLKEVLHLYKNHKVFLVDDRLEILKSASEVLPSLITIWVKRGFFAENQKPIKNYAPHAIIDTLQEVIPIVTANK